MEMETNATTRETATTTEGETTSDNLLETAGTEAQESTNDSSDEVKAEESNAEQKQTAPESYSDFTTESGDIDPQVQETFKGLAKELNLTQENAQKLLDGMAPKMQERFEQGLAQVRSEWKAASESDKEFGGEKLKSNLGIAVKALDTYGTPELRGFLDESGLGNHPEVIRMLYRVGQTLNEDTVVKGIGSNSKESDPAKRLYPNQA